MSAIVDDLALSDRLSEPDLEAPKAGRLVAATEAHADEQVDLCIAFDDARRGGKRSRQSRR